MQKRHQILAAAAVPCLLAGFGSQAWAATANWVPTAAGTYDWSTGSNWSGGTGTGGVPGTADLANLATNIAGDQTITISGTNTVGGLSLGDSDRSNQITLSGTGTLGIVDNKAITFNNGIVNSYINFNPTAVRNYLVMGSAAGNASMLNVKSGTFIDRGNSTVGNLGGAYVNVSAGGTLNNTTGATYFGYGSGGQGVLSVSGGSFNTGNTLQIGVSGTGLVYQSSGTSTVVNGVWLGTAATGTGMVYMTGGALTTTGTSVTNVTNLGVAATGGAGAGSATLTVAGTGSYSTGAITFGGTGSTKTNIVNVNGGVLQANSLAKTGGTALLNFNGGTLKAGATSTTFLSGLDHAYVYGGGATIDTNGKDITVGQALEAATGTGVSTIAVTDGGAGYFGAPAVVISGTGTGATAVANMVDDGTSSGHYKIDSITITNAGTGYTGTPTVSFVGGNATTAATLGTITTATNSSGGLTKTGTGTLTLSGTNTYTGATAISNGTLSITGSLANTSGVTVNSEATLSGTGTIAGATTVTGSLTAGTTHGVAGTASTLTFSNSLALNGTTNLDLFSASSADKIVATSITEGGTINVANAGGFTFAAGQSWDLFDGTLSGSFTTVLPSLASSMKWNTSALNTTGVLSIDNATIKATIGLSNSVDNTNVATGGTVNITGTGGKYISEIDELNSNEAKGSVALSETVSAPTYAMLWLTGGTDYAQLASDLTGTGVLAMTSAAGDAEWTNLAAHYSGFNMLVKFDGSGSALNWDFGIGNSYGGVVVDRVAVVPEPASLGVIAIGALGLLGRRRRKVTSVLA